MDTRERFILKGQSSDEIEDEILAIVKKMVQEYIDRIGLDKNKLVPLQRILIPQEPPSWTWIKDTFSSLRKGDRVSISIQGMPINHSIRVTATVELRVPRDHIHGAYHIRVGACFIEKTLMHGATLEPIDIPEYVKKMARGTRMDESPNHFYPPRT